MRHAFPGEKTFLSAETYWWYISLHSESPQPYLHKFAAKAKTFVPALCAFVFAYLADMRVFYMHSNARPEARRIVVYEPEKHPGKVLLAYFGQAVSVTARFAMERDDVTPNKSLRIASALDDSSRATGEESIGPEFLRSIKEISSVRTRRLPALEELR